MSMRSCSAARARMVADQLTRAKSPEVFNRPRDGVRVQLKDDAPRRRAADGNVEEADGVFRHGFLLL